MEEIEKTLEALIFVSEVPLSLEKIAQVLEGLDKRALDGHLKNLIREYDARDGGIYLQEVAGGFQFRTKRELSPWIKKLKGVRYNLTIATMETLAVIAYRQPVLKAEIDALRGVDSGGPLKRLLDKKIVRIMGRKDVPGKPIIYGTTKKFLEVFNLKDLSELPTLKEFKELEESRDNDCASETAEDYSPGGD